MMRVISSPSSSTTGFFTLIFAMEERALRLRSREAGRLRHARAASAAAIAPRGKGRKREGLLGGQRRDNRLHRVFCSRTPDAMPGAGTDRTKAAPVLAGPI